MKHPCLALLLTSLLLCSCSAKPPEEPAETSAPPTPTEAVTEASTAAPETAAATSETELMPVEDMMFHKDFKANCEDFRYAYTSEYDIYNYEILPEDYPG